MENQSAEIKDLVTALVRVQKDLKGAVKDSENPFFHSKYADLSSVWDACRDLLSVNGLAVIQTNQETDGGTVTVITTLAHTSGQWVRGALTMKPTKADPQGVGSAITYARRYALAAIVGVCPEDDDGAKASGTDKPPRESSQNKNAQHDLGTFSDYVKECVKGKSGTTGGKSWQVWIIVTQENGEVGTYEKKVFDVCCQAAKDGTKVKMESKPGKHGTVISAAMIDDGIETE